MRELVYTIFISINRASFHLWWKKNLLKHQKGSKYFESGCRFGWAGGCVAEHRAGQSKHNYYLASKLSGTRKNSTLTKKFKLTKSAFNLGLSFYVPLISLSFLFSVFKFSARRTRTFFTWAAAWTRENTASKILITYNCPRQL